MTTKREAILDDVASTLAGITIANGFLTDVVTVDRAFRTYDEVDKALMPWVGFWPGPERPRISSFEMLDVTLPINVLAHVAVAHEGNETAFQAAATEAASNIQRDIISALMTDIRRDANAIETVPAPGSHSETDEGVPDVVTNDGGTVTVKMTFEVLFEVSTTGSA